MLLGVLYVYVCGVHVHTCETTYEGVCVYVCDSVKL